MSPSNAYFWKESRGSKILKEMWLSDNKGEEYLHSTATNDGTLMHHYNPKEKRQSVEYRDNNSFFPKKFKVQVPTGKKKCGDDNIWDA
jgi:hypothetical protein